MKQLFRRHEYGSGTERGLVLFFCPYGIGAWQYALPGLPIWRLTRAGWKVIAYDYPLAIANRNASLSAEGIEALMSHVAKAVVAERPPRLISWGVSFGGLPAMLAATRIPGVERVVMNVPWTDLPVNIRHLPPMILIPGWLRRRFIRESGGMAELTRTLAPYQPAELARRLPMGLPVLAYMARKDRLIKFADGEEFRQALAQRCQGNFELVINNRLGHYWGALHNNLAYQQYFAWLGRRVAPQESMPKKTK